MSKRKSSIPTNSTPFKKVENLQIIVSVSGVQKQVDVYERESTLYANAKGGYVTIYADKGTSVPSLLWKCFVYPDVKLPDMQVSSMNFLQLV